MQVVPVSIGRNGIFDQQAFTSCSWRKRLGMLQEVEPSDNSLQAPGRDGDFVEAFLGNKSLDGLPAIDIQVAMTSVLRESHKFSRRAVMQADGAGCLGRHSPQRRVADSQRDEPRIHEHQGGRERGPGAQHVAGIHQLGGRWALR